MTRLPDPARGGATAAALVLALTLAAALDVPLASAAARAPARLVSLGRFVSGFGTSGYMFALSALVGIAALVALRAGWARWRGASLRLVAERAGFFFAALALSGLADQVLKHLIGRARPRLLIPDGAFHFEPLSLRDVLASFPSGHTTSAFAAAVALGLMRPDRRPLLLACAALIGLSRILVGAHYPSDVVGGAALGSAVTSALARGFARRGLALAWRDGRPEMIPLRTAALRRTPT